VRGRVTAGLALLRTTGLGALVLLLWNPTTSRFVSGAGAAPPLVLLDASLSMVGHGGRWREALDTARALARAGSGGPWRGGTGPWTGGRPTVAPAGPAARIACRSSTDATPPEAIVSTPSPAMARAPATSGPASIPSRATSV